MHASIVHVLLQSHVEIHVHKYLGTYMSSDITCKCTCLVSSRNHIHVAVGAHVLIYNSNRDSISNGIMRCNGTCIHRKMPLVLIALEVR
jgi:hypothetical protein